MRELKSLVKLWQEKLLGYQKLKEINNDTDTPYAQMMEGKITTTKAHIDQVITIIKKYDPEYGN